jgi:hypothetical protein
LIEYQASPENIALFVGSRENDEDMALREMMLDVLIDVFHALLMAIANLVAIGEKSLAMGEVLLRPDDGAVI